MSLEVVKDKKILDCTGEERVIIFSTGGRRFVGKITPEQLVSTGFWWIDEVYELLSFQGLVPGKIAGSGGSISVQTMLMYPDLGASLGEPVETMKAKVDWFYDVSEKALELIRQNVKSLGHR
jgi:hypothetical protein